MHGLTHIRLEPIQNTDKMSSRLASRRGPPHTTSRQCSRYQGRKQSPRPHFLHSHSSSSWHYTPSLPSVAASRPINERQPEAEVLQGYFRLATSHCQPLGAFFLMNGSSPSQPTNYLKPPAVQSKCLRVIGNYPRRTPTPTPTSHLHHSLNIEPIPVIIHRLTAKCFAYCPAHLNQLYSSRSDCCVQEVQTMNDRSTFCCN